MKYWLVSCLAAALYLLAGTIIYQRLWRGNALVGVAKTVVFVLGVIAVVLHAFVLHSTLQVQEGLNLALTNAISLVAWAMAALFLVTTLYKPIANLGIVVMPASGLSVLAAWLWPGHPVILATGSSLQSLHIIVSVLAYGLLALAVLESLLWLAQDHQLRQRQAGTLLHALPPLETMERLMFQLIGLGFVLLSLTLVSGAMFSEQLFGKPLRFTHHVVLSLLSWLVFAILLFGRWHFGWRGRPAVRWILSGFALLALAYFGTKFVMEIVLGRS
jgi:ABC-type uncharacterized transport system permease subunit